MLVRVGQEVQEVPRGLGPAALNLCRAASLSAMAGAATSQPTPQRLAAIREQLSLLADYL